jgi:hypothetical protein
MFTKEDQDAIIHFLFDDKHNNFGNVELALGIIAAREKINRIIINKFLNTLTEYLNQQIKNLGESWIVVNELQQDPFERYEQIYITKNEWKDLYRVALGPEEKGARGFIFGVWSRKDKLGHRFDGGRISASLKRLGLGGATSDVWPFWKRVDDYKNWDDPKTLSCFLEGQNLQAIEYLAGCLLAIARETENVIDSLVHTDHI